jgi:photolyase PhrII
VTEADLLESLPRHLAERVWGSAARRFGHGMVVYWMRLAARAHENPALDVAIWAARKLDRPLLVYHALSERYPYASDRHHRFFLEGARDVQAECAARSLSYGFHLERPGHRGRHLETLAASAALLVTEDVPVAPLDSWTRRLSLNVATPVWQVDAACTFPMRQVPDGVVDRASAFRSATAQGRRARIDAGWPEVEHSPRPFTAALPFRPVDLATADLDALVATCAIDHEVAPVPHTPGGSESGYRRWAEFAGTRVARYHRARNDPLAQGVSRMSAYLHYGQVSPMRLARDLLRGEPVEPGPAKYLDELLVWRELAWAFCAARPDHATVSVLPSWARDTLTTHESDPRPAHPSWEALSRARTGDALWDAAQASLRIHGELHNNVRMTWGKRLLSWTSNAEAALAALIDLNHRYALDGRDPASYGGLLWCLGAFDRPFSPERSILGTIRDRSTEAHGRRLDPAAWAQRTGRPAIERPPRVAVIGAGLAGLACARTLRDHGLSPVVFDKGRRPGGRCSSRESRSEPTSVFDHGTQFFTVRDPHFARLVESWQQDGKVARWAAPGTEESWVGVPSMSAIPRHLAEDLDVRCGVRIVDLRPVDRGHGLFDEGGLARGDFDTVVVTAPPAQARPLVVASVALTAAVDRASMAPCWAIMLIFDAPLDLPNVLPGRGRVVAWAARDSSKADRPAGERWVVHATPEWSSRHLAAEPDTIATTLTEAFLRFAALPDQTVPCRRPVAHLWRYARVVDGPGGDGRTLADPAAGLVLAGDWVMGEARLEAAWLSGVAAGARVLSMQRAGPLRLGGAPSESATSGVEQGDLFGG